MTPLPRYHAARWDEPIVTELGQPGRRGAFFDGDPSADALIPAALARRSEPVLPALSEPEVFRHYLHLAQMTLGMQGVSLFGTCTMKYNAPVSEAIAWRPEMAETHPLQDASTLQGTLEFLHRFDLMLRELSGMDQFIFQPGGGADAAYTNCAVTRAWLAARGELGTRDEIITSIQAHPCNPATAATAGFKVITLTLEENGYPSIEQLKTAVSHRTAALMIGNPDDMGIYNPDIKEWVRIVHEAGGLCFYDHANFNGVMGKLRARELGFDACMYMLHKTFGAPKGGNGPSVGAYGCSAELAPFLPAPLVVRDGDEYNLDYDRPQSCGKIREYFGNAQQVMKAYAWVSAMGADGIHEASDLSVLANNYMDARLAEIPSLARSHADIATHRMEMTRWSMEPLKRQTGVSVFDVQRRMTDFGIDAFWLSHEPWVVPEPFTPEAGEMWSKEEIDRWIDVLATVVDEAYNDPEKVRSAPHNQAIHQLNGSALNDPDRFATTMRRLKAAAAAGLDGI
ncbi:MAG TPA: aminomethyl-transferring glycine dehydrogenase subunit GcvPB [Shinella sp.]|jgi:glycine dehydrogenase subunit 2|uniref:aminomethyl-transferring glycine dehydrogenase subunit GcvPB n=1 Tax=Shinella sp. TaxID=1870904 RepID=UPI002E146A0D|nr:aminomethyl-transferring glycine dehydrogenase subunit GcvPB [Shinella sp.]